MDTMRNHLKIAALLANLLDNKFSLFGIRFGFASIFDLIPEVGDIITFILSFYLIWIGLRLGLPSSKIAQMVTNTAINFLIGLIPIAGGIVYIMRKANMRNLKILQEYVDKQKNTIEGEIIAHNYK
jgi:hypothetical protein